MIESSNSRAAYSGNGTTTQFPFNFKVWRTDQLKVILQDPDNRITEATGWSAVLTDTGGTVTYRHNGAPLSSGWRIAIVRSMPFTQGADLISGARWDPAVVEDALDQATVERQQLLEIASRAIQMPPTSTVTVEQYGADLINARKDAMNAATRAATSETEAKAARDTAISAKTQAVDQINRQVAQGLVEIGTAKGDALGSIRTTISDISNAQANAILQVNNTKTQAITEVNNAKADIASKRQQALNDIEAKRASSVSDVTSAHGTAKADITSAHNKAKADIATDRAKALADIAAGKAEHIKAIEDAANAGMQLVRDEIQEAVDYADKLENIAVLAVGEENVETIYPNAKGILAGDVIDLAPFVYFVGRQTLTINWEGVELYRGIAFEEVGEDGKPSSKVRFMINIPAGDRLRLWCVASNLSVKADAAIKAAEEAAKSAEQAGNAAAEAGEAADRAEEAASDSEEAAKVAVQFKKEIEWLACMHGKGRIHKVHDLATFEMSPQGWYVLDNEDECLPAQCAQPLVSFDKIEEAPDSPDYFYVLAGPMDCVHPDEIKPKPDGPDGPDKPDGPDDPDGPDGPGGPVERFSVCGKRIKQAA